jgi:hypothetical protein
MTDIARFCDLIALSRDQKKLFPHFGEPGTAVFAVEDVEYGRHDRTPLFDQCGILTEDLFGPSSHGAENDFADERNGFIWNPSDEIRSRGGERPAGRLSQDFRAKRDSKLTYLTAWITSFVRAPCR